MHQVGYSVEVGFYATVVPKKQRRGLGLADHLDGVYVGERRDSVGPVAQQLGRDTRYTKGDHRSEQRVLGSPDGDRNASRSHRLDDESGLSRVRDRPLHGRPGVAHLRGVVDVAPDIGEVGPVP